MTSDEPEYLREQAAQCRALAQHSKDLHDLYRLLHTAKQYESQAAALEAGLSREPTRTGFKLRSAAE